VRLSEAVNLPGSYNLKAKGGNIVHSLVEVLLVELYKMVRSDVFTMLLNTPIEANMYLCLIRA
jgi:hypothetical protein